MIKDDGFLANDMPSSGKYDDLIDVGVGKHTPELPACVSGQFLQGTFVTDVGGRDGKKSASSCIRRDGEITISGYPHM